MNPSQNPKTHSSKLIKKRLSQDQVRLLEASFDATKKLEPELKFRLARELGVPPRQIAIWYQNKRARWKNQSLEMDHGAIQVRLEAALAEKERLEMEVDSLRGELRRAQEMLFGLGQAHQAQAQSQAHQLFACAGAQHVPVSSALSSCCDDGAGSSSLNDDVGCSANLNLEFEELYACLMVGANKQSVHCGTNNEGVNRRDFWV